MENFGSCKDIDSSKEEDEPALLRVKEEVQGSFDLRKKSKNVTIEKKVEKKVEKIVFMGGPYEGHELSYVALYDTKYLRGLLKMSGLDKKKTKDLIKQALTKTQLFLTLCINHTPISPEAKTIKAHVCLAKNPTALPRRLKIAPARLPTIAGNASTAFPASLLSASASLSSHFSKTSLSFGGEPPVPPPPQRHL